MVISSVVGRCQSEGWYGAAICSRFCRGKARGRILSFVASFAGTKNGWSDVVFGLMVNVSNLSGCIVVWWWVVLKMNRPWYIYAHIPT